jgi:hypothetical protein
LPAYPGSKFNTLRSTGHRFINFFRTMEIPPFFQLGFKEIYSNGKSPSFTI